jgi:uncharacterized membrane protein
MEFVESYVQLIGITIVFLGIVVHLIDRYLDKDNK